MKKVIAAAAAVLLLTGCSSAADVASQNVSREADQFKVTRRIIATNLITGDYLIAVTGKCSLGNGDDANEQSIICKVGEGDEYRKFYVGWSAGANVVITTEQIDAVSVDPWHYEVIFRPETILPSIVR